MPSHLALIRGINVGGKSLLPMADLRTALEAAGFLEVSTYIQSGNVLFSSSETNNSLLAAQIQNLISDTFAIQTGVVVFSAVEWQNVIAKAPGWWGQKEGWRHYLFVPFHDTSTDDVVKAFGALKADIEQITAGPGVVYQSLLITKYGQTTSGMFMQSPLYKKVTIRNFNTTMKLGKLLEG